MSRPYHLAKKLRKDSTDTERLLWHQLRAKRFCGLKWTRQRPIGKYIVDFVCYEKKLIIECDGSQHITQAEQDKQRDQWLKEQGFKVLRFWDNEVLQNLEGVLEVIFKAITPSP